MFTKDFKIFFLLIDLAKHLKYNYIRVGKKELSAMKTLSAERLKNAKPFKRLDIIVYLIVFITVLALFLHFTVFAKKGKLNGAEVTVNGKTAAVYDFTLDKFTAFNDTITVESDDKTTLIFCVNKDANVICIDKQNRFIYVKTATCGSQDCVHSAKITKANQSIICAPHKLVVKGTGNAINDPILG